MSIFGDTILNMLGRKDPSRALAAAALGARPGAAAVPPAPVAGAPAMGTAAGQQQPPAPPAPKAYDSPADLLSLYTELSDRQSRARRIDNGIGLIGASFAQPENRASILQMANGGGGSDSSADALSTILAIQDAQREQQAATMALAEKERRRATLPAIAEQYGLDMDTAGLLFDNDQMDDYIMEKSKYKDADTSIVEDTGTGAKRLINNGTGETIMELGGSLAPTADQKNYEADMADRKTRGEPVIPYKDWLTEDANRKAPKTTINNNMGNQVDSEMAKQLDAPLTAQIAAAQDSVTTIQQIRSARTALNAPGGIIAGSITAPLELEGRKQVARMFGLEDTAADNSQTLMASLQSVVLPLLKQTGTGNSISNADREFINKMVGADLTLTPATIGRLMDLIERNERNKIIVANEQLKERVNKSDDDSPLRRSARYIEVPELSKEYLSTVNPDDIAELKAAALEGDEDFIRMFEEQYGRDTARLFLGE